MSIYENVKAAAEKSKDQQGVVQRPAVEMVSEHLQELGYHFAGHLDVQSIGLAPPPSS